MGGLRAAPALRAGPAFGWTQAEVAGHLAFWMERCAQMLEASAEGQVEDGAFEVDIDQENDARRAGWRRCPPTRRSRRRSRPASARFRVVGVQEPTGSEAGWFTGDTFEHYDEHTGGA